MSSSALEARDASLFTSRFTVLFLEVLNISVLEKWKTDTEGPSEMPRRFPHSSIPRSEVGAVLTPIPLLLPVRLHHAWSCGGSCGRQSFLLSLFD